MEQLQLDPTSEKVNVIILLSDKNKTNGGTKKGKMNKTSRKNPQKSEIHSERERERS